ncbi:MAG: MEDS domain-containing protein, partial [Thermoproteota archaeon]
HMCFIYRNKEEQLSVLSSFMSVGTEKNEKCLYIVDERTKKEVTRAFQRQDFDVEKTITSGQFKFLTKSSSYLKNGYFDPERMIDLLAESEDKSSEEGYNGLRVTGEMTWFFSNMPGVERLMEYENKLNEFLPNSKVIALCQYNENRFSPKILLDVIHTHPRTLIYDTLYENPYYLPPKVFSARLRGEVTQGHYESVRKDIIQRNKIKKERDKISEKLEVVGKLARHDVQNKLSTINNNLYLAQTKLADGPPEVQEYLEEIKEAVDQANKIFDFAKTYEQLGTQELQPMDVGESVEEALPPLFSELKERGIDLTNECGGLTVKADKLLPRLFYNLLQNSLQHGGETLNKIRIHPQKTEEGLTIIYEDDGVGIPEEEKEKIFQEGYGRGTGYGLYLIQKMCEVYGWTIHETGTPGEGGQFLITTPKKE